MQITKKKKKPIKQALVRMNFVDKNVIPYLTGGKEKKRTFFFFKTNDRTSLIRVFQPQHTTKNIHERGSKQCGLGKPFTQKNKRKHKDSALQRKGKQRPTATLYYYIDMLPFVSTT